MTRTSIACVLALTFLSTSFARAADPASETNGKPIVELMTKADMDVVIKQLEVWFRVEIDAPTKAKWIDDFQRLQARNGNYTSYELVEVAEASSKLRRETWLLTNTECVLRVQFVFYVTAQDGPRLVLFRYDTDYWDLPWKPIDRK